MYSYLTNLIGDFSARSFRAARARDHDAAPEPRVIVDQRELIANVKGSQPANRAGGKLTEAVESGLAKRSGGKPELTPLGEYGEYVLSAEPDVQTQA